ncbi:MAG: 3-hydroxy-3-methylglutaryl-CoA reductase, partial [Candidatus Methanomethylophilaceae archaeon]|nr:3-hydroxy-3-methylglutaryl-CoA reductase [Candidatus Methanomethylophilaceae archaeon]
MTAQDDLKNRGMERSDVDARRAAVEKLTETKLDTIASYPFEPQAAAANVENMIGVVQIPLGFAGPVTVNGDHAMGPFIIPLATTEGALIASISRGMSVISAAGGARVKVFSDGMTRA